MTMQLIDNKQFVDTRRESHADGFRQRKLSKEFLRRYLIHRCGDILWKKNDENNLLTGAERFGKLRMVAVIKRDLEYRQKSDGRA